MIVPLEKPYQLHRRATFLQPRLSVHPCCPLCRGNLVPFHDNIHGGDWLYCYDCKCHGDQLMIAANTRKEPVRNLARLLLPDVPLEDIDTYEEVYVKNYALTEAFWEDARKHTLTSSDLRTLRMHLHIQPGMQSELWPSRGGDLIGGAGRKAIDDYLGLHGSHSIFRGHGHDESFQGDMLVLPFEDLPGRISAFLFVGQSGRPEEDYVYRPILPYMPKGSRTTGPAVPGMFGLSNGYRNTLTEDPFFVLLDPLLAAKLYVKHKQLLGTHIPVAAVWPDSAPSPYGICGVGPMVLWDHLHSPNLYRHAIAVSGKVAVSTAKLQDIHRQVQRHEPMEWLRIVGRHAKFWTDALEEHLRTLPFPAAEEFLLRIDMPRLILKDFLDGCSPATKHSLYKIYTGSLKRQQVSVGKMVVEERDGGWYNFKTGELLLDAIIRVDTVVSTADGNFLQGKVIYRGEELPFWEIKRKIERYPLRWLDDFLISRGKGVPEYGSFGSTHILQVAMKLRPPELVRGGTRFGWEEDVPGFVFPNFTIGPGGVVTDGYPPQVDGPIPAQNLNRPLGLSESDCEALSDGQAGQTAWACLLVILHNLMAGPWGYETKGLALTGLSTTAAGALLVSEGCARTAISHLTVSSVSAWKHGWPLLLGGEPGWTQGWVTWLTEQVRNHVIPMNALMGDAVTAAGGWFRLGVDRPLEISTTLQNAVAKVIPSYLQDLMTRRFQTSGIQSEPLCRIAADLTSWYVRQGGSASVVMTGERLIVTDALTQAADSFVTVLGKLYTDGKIRLDRSDFPVVSKGGQTNRRPAMLWFPGDGGSLWLGKADVLQLLQDVKLPHGEPTRITQALQAAGALIDERDVRSQPGWLVREDYWNDRLAVIRGGSKLKLVK